MERYAASLMRGATMVPRVPRFACREAERDEGKKKSSRYLPTLAERCPRAAAVAERADVCRWRSLPCRHADAAPDENKTTLQKDARPPIFCACRRATNMLTEYISALSRHATAAHRLSFFSSPLPLPDAAVLPLQ
jgi:hypothetical protein